MVTSNVPVRVEWNLCLPPLPLILSALLTQVTIGKVLTEIRVEWDACVSVKTVPVTPPAVVLIILAEDTVPVRVVG